MQFIHSPPGRDADGANEQLGAFLDDDIDQFGQFTVRVVLVGFARVATDLREEQVDAKRSVWVPQLRLEFADRLAQKLGRVADATDDTCSDSRSVNTLDLSIASHVGRPKEKKKKGGSNPPSPPALVTAAARLDEAAWFIPASTTGCCSLKKSVSSVRIC